ncbi:MAG TPA: YtxH domain-containing protein [Gemmatimonadales bacterium]|nr:YtxH domain-containing protein [Gemmatimonadales bacterium]
MSRAAESPDREIKLEVEGGSRAGGFAAGIAIGVMLGAAVALLFAPAQGQVTRGKLRRQLEDVREYAEDEFDDLRKKARKELRRRMG